MKLVVDLSAVKSGGGLQRAVNFAHNARLSERFDVTFVVSKSASKTFGELLSPITEVVVVPDHYVVRTLYEHAILFWWLKWERIDVVLTFAGTGLIVPGSVKSIVGIAYPIICYNDSVYWGYLGVLTKSILRAKNFLRIHKIRRADILFVQTEVMQRRIADILTVRLDTIKVLPPSPSEFLKEGHGRLGNRVLLLCGIDRHKNLWRLHEVADILRRRRVHVVFVISTTRERWKACVPGVKDDSLIDLYFEFLGHVDVRKINDVYATANIALQLSDLESFSNNYMEAWRSGIPLIASDRDFARHICGDSAVYVEPHAPTAVAESIVEVLQDAALCGRLVAKGKERLKALPTQAQYAERLIDIVEGAVNE